MMLVSGVRRSWETARRRLARSFSRSASASAFSLSAIACRCFLRVLVVVLVSSEIASMPIKVMG